MNQSITYIAATLFVLIVAAGLDHARRELLKKRRDYRMGQALRRGLLQSDVPFRNTARVLPWQSCETTSAHLS